MSLSDTNVIDTSQYDLRLDLLRLGKDRQCCVDLVSCKKHFCSANCSFAYTGDKAPVLSFVLLLTVLCLIGQYSCLANPTVHLRRFLGVFQKVVES